MKTFARAALAAVALLLLPLPAIPVIAQTAVQPIRVGAGPDDPSTPLLYAAQAGLYQRAGLNVELVKLAGAAVVAAALAGGSLEIGKGNTMSVVTAIGKGLPFTIIGSIANYSSDAPDQGLIVSTSIRNAGDLAGKTLAAISLQDIGSVATQAWLDRNGVDPKSVRYLEMPGSATLAAIDENRIVGTNINEPYFSSMLASGKVRILGYPFDVIGKRFPEAVMFANTGWVESHRDVVARFLRVVQDASSYVSAHEPESVGLLAQFGGIDPAAFAKIRHTVRGVAIAPGDLQPVIDLAAKYSIIPKAYDARGMICSCALAR
jgi:NitT/TauT family transport system substrate-binding protein